MQPVALDLLNPSSVSLVTIGGGSNCGAPTPSTIIITETTSYATSTYAVTTTCSTGLTTYTTTTVYPTVVPCPPITTTIYPPPTTIVLPTTSHPIATSTPIIYPTGGHPGYGNHTSVTMYKMTPVPYQTSSTPASSPSPYVVHPRAIRRSEDNSDGAVTYKGAASSVSTSLGGVAVAILASIMMIVA